MRESADENVLKVVDQSQFSVFFSVCVGCGCCGLQQEDANDK